MNQPHGFLCVAGFIAPFHGACRRRPPLSCLYALAEDVASPADAGPCLHLNRFVVSHSQAQCLKNTRQALLKLGIRADAINQTSCRDANGQRIQDGWTGDPPSENVSVSCECDGRNGRCTGMGAPAVAGGNNDATYSVYRSLWDLWME